MAEPPSSSPLSSAQSIPPPRGFVLALPGLAPAPAPAPPLPNAEIIANAMDGMDAEADAITQSFQTFRNHQRQMYNELSLCINYDPNQTQNQLNAIDQAIIDLGNAINGRFDNMNSRLDNMNSRLDNMNGRITKLMNAQYWNTNAKIQHAKVHTTTEQLVVMRTVSSNLPVAVNTPIQNFPNTAYDISTMTEQGCQHILTALEAPFPQLGPLIPVNRRELAFRTAVRQAIGLPAL